jgi:hypothetical protein
MMTISIIVTYGRMRPCVSAQKDLATFAKVVCFDGDAFNVLFCDLIRIRT